MLGLCRCWSLRSQIRSSHNRVGGSFSPFWSQCEGHLLRGALPNYPKQRPRLHCCISTARTEPAHRGQHHVFVKKQTARQPVPWSTLQLPSFLPSELGLSSQLPGSVAEVFTACSSPFLTLYRCSVVKFQLCGEVDTGMRRQMGRWALAPGQGSSLCSRPIRL